MIWPTGGRSPSKSASCRCGGSAKSSGAYAASCRMNQDFLDLLRALSAHDVRFMIVGAYALAVHGRPRATGDLDIWIDATPDNAARLIGALQDFGAPMTSISAADFSKPGIVFQMGLPPYRIDILTELTGIHFVEAWPHRVRGPFGELEADYIGRDAFIRNKRATGRARDLGDIEAL